MESNYLIHYGVKGMKWGVRKDNTNPNYRKDQQARDKVVYGRGGVRRINRSMNKGNNVSGARSKEAARINKARTRAKYSGTVGSIVGSVGGVVIGKKITSKVSKKLGYDDLRIDAAIMVGSVSLGKMLGRHGGKSLSMITAGYSPDKYR